MAHFQNDWRVIKGESLQSNLIARTKFDAEKCSYEIYVFDGCYLWCESLSRDAFQRKCKDLNPRVEADLSFLLEEIKKQCDGFPDNANISLEKEDGGRKCMIHLKFKLKAGIPFSWRFDLIKESQEAISNDIILPLFTIVGELSKRQKDLFKIIEKKDDEIQDYKDQGASTSRKSLETAHFDPVIFCREATASMSFVNNLQNAMATFTEETCQQLYADVMDSKGKQRTTDFERNETKGATQVTTSKQLFETQVIDGQTMVGKTFEDQFQSGSKDQVIDEEHTRREVIQKRLADKEKSSKVKKKAKKVNL